MRSGQKMTLWEVEKFLNNTEDVARSLTDPWELDPAKEYDYDGNPTGSTHPLPFNSKILLDTIMLKGGEMGVLYNNIATYYMANNAWWNKWKLTFQRWWEVEEMEYNPMWDRDGRRKYHEDVDDEGYNNNVSTDTEHMDDVATKTSTTVENMDDDTTFTSNTTESETTGTTKDSTNKEVMDDDTTKSSHTVEVMDDDTTSKSETSEEVQGEDISSGNVLNQVSAYDAGTNLVNHDKSIKDGIVDSTKTTTTGTSETGTDDRTTTTDVSETGTDDRTTNTTYSETGSIKTSKTTNVSNSGTDDRETTTTYNENAKDTVDAAKRGTSDTDTGNQRDIDHNYREWGQWGISTISQNMYALQIKVRKQNNLYELMSDMFIDEMTDGIWI